MLGASVAALVGCGSYGPTKARLLALDARTGAIRWEIRTGAIGVAASLVSGRKLVVWGYFPDNGGCVGQTRAFAVDTRTGRTVAAGAVESPPVSAIKKSGFSYGAIGGGGEVRSAEFGLLFAHAANGRLLWQRQFHTDQDHPDPMPIVIGSGIVAAYPNAYATGFGVSSDLKTSLVALDLRDGRILWRLPRRRGDIAFPGFSGHTVYAFENPQRLDALNAIAGSIRWHVKVKEGGITVSRPIVISSLGRVTALTRTGKQLWSVKVPTGSFPKAATVSGHMIYVPIEGATGSGCGD